MKMKQHLFLAIAIVFLYSFDSFDKTIQQDLVGIWVNKSYENSQTTYVKHSNFKKNEAGIEFKKEGKLIVRQNVGWCGTPPITYGNHNGTWEQTSDSTVTITYKYWRGIAKEDWLILAVSEKQLKVKRLAFRTVREE